MSLKNINKRLLEQLILGERLSLQQISVMLDVDLFELEKKVYHLKIDEENWWQYQGIFCVNCDQEHDVCRKLSKEERKHLLKLNNFVCEECQIKLNRENVRKTYYKNEEYRQKQIASAYKRVIEKRAVNGKRRKE